jgi:hypothetical protein
VYVQFLCDMWLLLLCTHCCCCACFLRMNSLRVLPWMLHWVGMVFPFVVCFCRYLSFISCNTSSIGLWVSMDVSFICSSSLLVLYIWYFSNVFRCFPFFLNYHGVGYTSVCMPRIQHVVWIHRIAVVTFYCLYMRLMSSLMIGLISNTF